MCQPGYRFPYWQQGPFMGVDIELATENEYRTGFDCIKVFFGDINNDRYYYVLDNVPEPVNVKYSCFATGGLPTIVARALRGPIIQLLGAQPVPVQPRERSVQRVGAVACQAAH